MTEKPPCFPELAAAAHRPTAPPEFEGSAVGETPHPGRTPCPACDSGGGCNCATSHENGYSLSLPDSGKRREFVTGSVRDVRDGKGRCDLLPPRALLELAVHFERGAAKYGDNNWLKGQPLSAYYDSGLRHMLKWKVGEGDEDHLVAAAWNLVAALETRALAAADLLPHELLDVGA